MFYNMILVYYILKTSHNRCPFGLSADDVYLI